QDREGVTPDLTILGKVIGGGLPAAAYAGRRDLMERVAPAGDVYQAGTLSGNPLAVAAGLATLNLLNADAYELLTQKTHVLAEGLERAAAEAGVPAAVVQAPGLLTLFFREGAPRNLADVQECNFDAHAAFCRGMLERGVYLPPSQYEAWFPSLAHSDDQLGQTVETAREVLAAL
ncbi:MAG TPA: aminotransferase class III-fold pyridoxal phosphate-dependent enzyme, partial [Thermoleophilaceae bacterium]